MLGCKWPYLDSGVLRATEDLGVCAELLEKAPSIIIKEEV